MDGILFPLCPSVVRGDSRIREETWKWKTWSKGLISPFRKQNTQIGQWFFKDASHQSSTACSFGLPLPDSVAFHFLGKKKLSYLPPRNSDTVCLLFYCELCPHPWWSTAACSVDFVLCFSIFIFGCMACGVLVPQSGIEPVPPALEAWSLSHWTSREIPHFKLLSLFLWNTWAGTISNKNATIQGEREGMPELPQEMRQDWGRAGAWGGL